MWTPRYTQIIRVADLSLLVHSPREDAVLPINICFPSQIPGFSKNKNQGEHSSRQ
jgi:hypothetical protein